MPRSFSRDIPMRRLPVPEPDAIRSYTTKRGGMFIVSMLMRNDAHRGDDRDRRWRVTHQPSGGHARMYSFGMCVTLIRKLTSAPKSEKERWVILARGDYAGQVLFDRASGRWWQRYNLTPVSPHELEAMSALRPIADFQMPLQIQDGRDAPVARAPERAWNLNAKVERWQARHMPRPFDAKRDRSRRRR